MTDRKLLYQRLLPGGGLVSIEAEPTESACRVVLLVERRTDPTRRDGHLPPVIAEAVAATEAVGFDQLYPIATNNVQLAQRIQKWQARKRGGMQS